MDERLQRLQRHRLRTTALTIVNLAFQALLVALFAASGATSWGVAAAFAVAGIGSTSLFTLAVALGWNLRFPDSWLLYAQLAANYLVQLVFIAAAPTLWIVFLVSSLLTFNYAMMGFTPRQFTAAWLAFGATTGLTLVLARHHLGYPPMTPANIALTWLFFFLAVRRLSLIGTQFTRLRAQLSEKNHALTHSLARIQELASHDDLTGTFNRRHFMQLVADERERARRTGQPYSVALFDLDHFKTINDRFGHALGDAVLREFCTLVAAHMRATDRFARYGGEEFVLLMPVTTPVENAALAVERIRAAVAAHDWGRLAGFAMAGPVTVSVGVATSTIGETVEDLLARADAALYEAKGAGRNRFALAR